MIESSHLTGDDVLDTSHSSALIEIGIGLKLDG
jgi:hypothetical protein